MFALDDFSFFDDSTPSVETNEGHDKEEQQDSTEDCA